MKIIPVPCLRDNYAYLVFQEGASKCLVIDPSEAGPVRSAVESRGLELVAVACTHHHHDHVGGNLELADPGVEVLGHASDRDRIPGLTRTLQHGDRVTLAGVTFEILHVPGHTRGAICYWAGEAAFTGDTLFCGGCGRLFEGTASQMYESLNGTLARLPDETTVFVGHEYTEANLEFARRLEPGNVELQARLGDVQERRRRGAYCAAATMALERATNPFLRCQSREVQAAVGLEQGEPEEVFARVRSLKDRT